jgi:hypothetical protein
VLRVKKGEVGAPVNDEIMPLGLRAIFIDRGMWKIVAFRARKSYLLNALTVRVLSSKTGRR